MILVKVNPAQYAELSAKLKAEEGLEIAGNSGTISKNGVTASYSYDGKSSLTVEVTAKPFLVSKALCEAHIRNAFAEQGFTTA